ncbi:MAG: CofH family radical SAM protein [Acidobacteriota bacterium]
MTIFNPEPTDYILEKALAGERISADEALTLYDEADLLKIIAAAREIRNRRHDPSIVTYTMFRIINYTNYCKVKCSFCSFHQPDDTGCSTTFTVGEILDKMSGAVAVGADQMFLQGGINPNIPFDYYLDVLNAVKTRIGNHIHIRGFSPGELMEMQEMTGLPLREVIRKLKKAGLDSVPGAGAEILSDRVRSILSPEKITVSDWVRVMETCHEEDVPGSANIVFGSIETREEIIEHLRTVRDLQDRTGGFLSFIPWTFQRQTDRFPVREVPVPEYLRVLAICRLFFDNIPHIEASILVFGSGVGSVALFSGADDISSVVIEENVLESHGPATEGKARDLIAESGFIPVKRDLLYNPIK